MSRTIVGCRLVRWHARWRTDLCKGSRVEIAKQRNHQSVISQLQEAHPLWNESRSYLKVYEQGLCDAAVELAYLEASEVPLQRVAPACGNKQV